MSSQMDIIVGQSLLMLMDKLLADSTKDYSVSPTPTANPPWHYTVLEFSVR